MASRDNGIVHVQEVEHDMTDSIDNNTLDGVLKAMFDDSWVFRQITREDHLFIEHSLSSLDEAKALLVEGILTYEEIFGWRKSPTAINILKEAEAKGCKHPLLYRYLVRCVLKDRRRAEITNPFECCLQSIGGTFCSDNLYILNICLHRPYNALFTAFYIFLTPFPPFHFVCVSL